MNHTTNRCIRKVGSNGWLFSHPKHFFLSNIFAFFSGSNLLLQQLYCVEGCTMLSTYYSNSYLKVVMEQIFSRSLIVLVGAKTVWYNNCKLVQIIFQTKTRWSHEIRRNHPGQSWRTEKGNWWRISMHLSNLPQNQIRRWNWAHMQLLQCQMLCTLWRKGRIEVQQGKNSAARLILVLIELWANRSPNLLLSNFIRH